MKYMIVSTVMGDISLYFYQTQSEVRDHLRQYRRWEEDDVGVYEISNEWSFDEFEEEFGNE